MTKMEAACHEAASEPRSSPSVEPRPSTGIWLDLEAATVHARKIKEVPTLQFGLLVQVRPGKLSRTCDRLSNNSDSDDTRLCHFGKVIFLKVTIDK